MIATVNNSAGVLGDPNGVKALQAALAALAKKRGDASMDPGSVDGIVGQRTLSALLSALQLVPIPKLSGSTKTIILATLGIGLIPGTPTYDIAKKTVDNYASTLAPAISAATAIVDAGGPVMPLGPGSGSLYPPGTIARFHVSRKVWRIYAPAGGGGMAGLPGISLSGLPGASLNGLPGTLLNGLGACANSASTATAFQPCGRLEGLPGFSLNGFGASAPPADATTPPAGTVLVGESPTLPAGVTPAGSEDVPWYKNWKVLVPLGVGVVVAGAGAYTALR